MPGALGSILSTPPHGRHAPDLPRAHRSDIDGLRAVAILPILLLHCGVTVVRGGFVGVDIFFVISGYLITGIIVRDIAAGQFGLLAFYRHRIVRILPALVVMMSVVLAVGCAVLLPNPLRDLARSVAAASGFVSNVYFSKTSDYFSAASDTKPLIHTWSLAVEEQFYLLYPLLLIALRRLSRPRLKLVLAGLAIASLAAGGALMRVDPVGAFFLLPGRLWELALGGIVALGGMPTIAAPRARAALCCGALSVVGTSCVVISSGWSFPIPFAIPPAVAAATLLAYGETGPTARLLSLAPMRVVGLLSYSLYLWHRPIIAFYEGYFGGSPGGIMTLGLFIASFVAAALSYVLVERPAIRRWRSGAATTPHLLALAVLAGGVAAGLAVSIRADAIRPLPPALRTIAGYLGHDRTAAGRAQFSTDHCFVLPTGAAYDPACLRLATDRRNVVLLGDSHGAHLSQALRAALPEARVLQATAAGCRPLRRGKGVAGCRAVMDRAFGTLDFGAIDTVILSARWLPFEQPALIETIAFLRARGTRVVVIGPSVEYGLEMPILLVRMRQTGDRGLADRFRLGDRIALDRAMAPAIRGAGAVYVSATDFECPAGRCRLVTPVGIPYHFDHSHFTPDAARLLVAGMVAHDVLAPVVAH